MKNQEKTHDSPIREFVALQLIDNLGAQRIRLLMQSVEHPQLIFRLKKHELQSIRGIGPKTARDITGFNDWDKVDAILEKTRRSGTEIMTFWDEDYPLLLREIFDPPIMLWIRGDRSLLSRPGIAVVGTRKAGNYAQEMADKFSRELCEYGLPVISGLGCSQGGRESGWKDRCGARLGHRLDLSKRA